MTVTSSLIFALTVYGLAAAISFFVALLIKGLHFSLNTLEAAPAPVPQLDLPPTSEITPELVAVIAAAATVAVGKKVQVKRIQAQTADTTWAKQGRVAIMTSHRTKS